MSFCRALGPRDRSHCKGQWPYFWWIRGSCLSNFLLVSWTTFKVFSMRLIPVTHIQLQTQPCHLQLQKPFLTSNCFSLCLDWRQSLTDTALLTDQDTQWHEPGCRDLEQSRRMIIWWIHQTKDEQQSNTSSTCHPSKLISFLLQPGCLDQEYIF